MGMSRGGTGLTLLDQADLAVRDHDWHRLKVALAEMRAALNNPAAGSAQDIDFAPTSESKNVAALEGEEA
jgi:hypothetical protein